MERNGKERNGKGRCVSVFIGEEGVAHVLGWGDQSKVFHHSTRTLALQLECFNDCVFQTSSVSLGL